MSAQQSLMDQLEEAVSSGSREKRVETLRRVTDLFLAAPARFSGEQIDVFDDVLTHLIARVETKARAELATRLAPVDHAPGEVIRKLAFDDEITVAGPVLTQSTRLSTDDLVEVAQQKSQGHLLAIAGRSVVDQRVTDVLVDRGDGAVMHTLAGNSGAAFSQAGYSTLVKRSEGDESLIEKLGRRLDIPLQLFRELLLKATEAVRERLLASADAERREEIQKILASVSAEIIDEDPQTQNVQDAVRLAQMMKETGRLSEAELVRYAKQRKYHEAVAVLAAMCAVPFELIDRLMHSDRSDALLVPCKAAGLGWNAVRAMLEIKGAGGSVSESDLSNAAAEFNKLTHATAGRVLRFWQVRQTVGAQSVG
jgi:uncharacterized protein (DUF2336 family)